MEDLGFVAIPAIIVIVYLVAEAVKVIFKKYSTEDMNKLIPVVCGLTGAILGVAMFYLTPDMMIASDPFTALAIGIFSGLSSVGVNQVGKQLLKKNDTVDIASNPDSDDNDQSK